MVTRGNENKVFVGLLSEMWLCQSWSHVQLEQSIINLHFCTLEFVMMIPTESFLPTFSENVASLTDNNTPNGKIMAN